jgi:hypothetical protein
MPPRSFYHGTSIEAAFKIQETGFRVDLAGSNAGALLGPGVYCTTTMDKALHYAKQHPQQGVLFELEVDLGRCKVLKQGDPMMQTWQSHDYDSAWAPEGASGQGLEENCIKDPARIRIVNVSAGHTGKLREMRIAVKNGRLINTCNMPECKRETWNRQKGEQCCRTCRTSNGTSHGPDCEAKQGEHATQVHKLLALQGTHAHAPAPHYLCVQYK